MTALQKLGYVNTPDAIRRETITRYLVGLAEETAELTADANAAIDPMKKIKLTGQARTLAEMQATLKRLLK